MLGELENVRGNQSLLFIQRLKTCTNVQKEFLPPGLKLTSDMQPIAPTSSLTIGNTPPFGCSFILRCVEA
jgi:hypothetical protein